MILSGGSDGLVAVSSPTTGMTVRVLNDHKGAPITCIDVTSLQVRAFSFLYKMSSFPKSMHLLDMKINYLIIIVMLSLEFSVLDIFSQFHLTLLGPG